MPPEMTAANRGAELEWAEDHEEHARNNVDERKVPVTSENVIEPGEWRGYRMDRRWGRTIAVRNDRSKAHDSAGCDSDSDDRQKNDGDPQRATKARTRIHMELYAPGVAGLSHDWEPELYRRARVH
jgi:hypothetical protein